MVHSGMRLTGPAREKTNGSEEITLLPNWERTQSATPNVIRSNEIKSRKCCHKNETVFSLTVRAVSFGAVVSFWALWFGMVFIVCGGLCL